MSAFQNHRWREPRSLRERISDWSDWFFEALDRPLKILMVAAIITVAVAAIAHARGP